MFEFRIQEKMLQSNKNRVNCLKMSVWSLNGGFSEGQNLQFNVSHIAFVEGKNQKEKQQILQGNQRLFMLYRLYTIKYIGKKN